MDGEIPNLLYRILGQSVLVVTANVGIAYAAFRYFGKKWLDTKFAERLETFKHERQKELEKFRFQINSLFDRATILHQKEFDALPEIWSKLNDAFWSARSITGPLQTYPDLDKMKKEQLDEFLRTCPLSDWQKEELKTTNKKTDYYRENIFWNRITESYRLAREYHVFLIKQGIFLTQEFDKKFEKLDNMIWAALDERQMREKYNESPLKDQKGQNLQDEGESALKELKEGVRQRLWDSEKLRDDLPRGN